MIKCLTQTQEYESMTDTEFLFICLSDENQLTGQFTDHTHTVSRGTIDLGVQETFRMREPLTHVCCS
jgi:hypothetical protein